jgi:predicted dehydrogenase
MRPIFAALLLALFVPRAAPGQDRAPAPLRLAVIGLVHGHVEGLLWQAGDRDEIELVGVWEPNRALFDRMATKHGLDPDLYFDDLGAMLNERAPEAVSVMTSTRDHLMAVEACAPRGVHLMVEKPLAVSNKHAERMAALAREHGVHLLTNYETSWYASVHEARRLTRSWYAPVRRAVFRHGHPGPVEIGCAPEFLEWLTDAEQNGAGALFDFGCYGANLMTWLRDGEAPASVLATAHTNRPGVYPGVDDDATIVLTYPDAVAVVQGSWSWTHDNKEMDLFTPRGSLHAGKWDALAVRAPDTPEEEVTPEPRPQPLGDEWSYLRAVVRGEVGVDPLSSLENNLVVVRILDAARRSAETGRAVKP